MKSPFPGMDTYIEACGLWEGFHGHLIEAIYRAIATALPGGYTVDTATRGYVVVMQEEGKDEDLIKPDVTITEPAPGKKPRKKKGGVAVAETAEDAESVRMQAFIAQQFEESFVEIYLEGEERILVTCIEVLSPSNKRQGTEGWLQYERKRQEMLLGRANFIEIDLLRGGSRFPMMTTWPKSPYTLLVARSFNAPICRVWPSHFHRRLPVIPVPLLYHEPELSLDLQPLLDGIYALGRYDERIDYTRPLTPALSDQEAVWMRDVLKTHPTGSSRKRRPPN